MGALSTILRQLTMWKCYFQNSVTWKYLFNSALEYNFLKLETSLTHSTNKIYITCALQLDLQMLVDSLNDVLSRA